MRTRQTDGVRTLLALVAATAMIVAALYFRAGGSDGDGRIIPDLASEPASLVCIPELASVCEDLAGDDVDVTIEEAGDTADRLAGTNVVAHDAWLTLAPWPQIAAQTRDRELGPDLPPAGGPLARSPLVMVVARERAEVLDDECGGVLSWRCVGRVAGLPWSRIGGAETWGQVKPGFRDPELSASGLLVAAQASTEFVQAPLSVRGMDTDAFLAWSAQLEQSVQSHGTSENPPLERQVQIGPASFDVVGALEAEAAPALTSQRARNLELRYPETMVVAEVVLAPLREGRGADRLRDLLAESGGPALAAAGWRVAGELPEAVPSDAPAVPDDANLPEAGVLYALRATWGEIQR